MSALRAEEITPEPNRFSVANDQVRQNVKVTRQKHHNPWAEVLGGLDAAITELELLAVDDRPVPPEAVGPIAVVTLRANPFMAQAQLRRIYASGSPVEAQAVVYAAIGPVLVNKTYKTFPDLVPELIEDASFENPSILDDAEVYENVVKLDGLNRIQIWSAQEIKEAEQTIRRETNLDSPAVKQARAVLIHLKCGAVDASDLEKVLQTPDEPLLPWVPEEHRQESSEGYERQDVSKRQRVRVAYVPTDADVDLATSILDKAANGQSFPKGLLQRAQIIIEFHEDPYVPRPALAAKLGIPVATIHSYRQQFADRGGFIVGGRGPKPKGVKALATPGPMLAVKLRVRSHVAPGYVPSEEEVSLARSIIYKAFAGEPLPRGVHHKAQTIMALHEDPKVFSTVLGKKLGISDQSVRNYIAGFIAQGGFKVAERQPKFEQVRRVHTRARQLFVPTDEDVSLATSVLEKTPADNLRSRGLRRRAEVVLAFRENPSVSLPELAVRLGVGKSRVDQILHELLKVGRFEVKVQEPKASAEFIANPGFGRKKKSALIRLPSRDVRLSWMPTDEEVALAKSILQETYTGPKKPIALSRQAELILGFRELNLSIDALANRVRNVSQPTTSEPQPTNAGATPSRQLSNYVPTEADAMVAKRILGLGSVALPLARRARVVLAFYSDPTLPMKVVAEKVGVTQERVRQICVDLKTKEGFKVEPEHLA